MIEVLDKGYVRLVDWMGSDTSVVNAARVSFDKESEQFNDQDAKLINYLAKHGHMSPFRHATISFEVKAPLLVARQWWKYVVGSDHTMDSWNEVSRRYVSDEPEFYIPEVWRAAASSNKQGSGAPVDESVSGMLSTELSATASIACMNYQDALDKGICPEQARLFLPAYAMYTKWRWTASLQSVAHFLAQRLEHDAQLEIRDYAQAVRTLTEELFPFSIRALIRKEANL